MFWNHRTVVHKNAEDEDHEDYMTCHEFYFEDGKIVGFSRTAVAPTSKEEAERLVRAYDRPPLAWVDDASMDKDGTDYAVWGWTDEANALGFARLERDEDDGKDGANLPAG